jgi:hypothetical protein
MFYTDRDHAISARFYLNNGQGFPSAYIYRTTDGRFTVIRTYNVTTTHNDAHMGLLTLDD